MVHHYRHLLLLWCIYMLLWYIYIYDTSTLWYINIATKRPFMIHHCRHLLLLWPRKLQFWSLPHQLLRQFVCSAGCVFIIVATKIIIIINVIQIGLTIIHWVSVRDGLTRKNCYSFGFCPNEQGACPNFLAPVQKCIFGL